MSAEPVELSATQRQTPRQWEPAGGSLTERALRPRNALRLTTRAVRSAAKSGRSIAQGWSPSRISSVLRQPATPSAITPSADRRDLTFASVSLALGPAPFPTCCTISSAARVASGVHRCCFMKGPPRPDCEVCPRCGNTNVNTTLATEFVQYCLCWECWHVWSVATASVPTTRSSAPPRPTLRFSEAAFFTFELGLIGVLLLLTAAITRRCW